MADPLAAGADHLTVADALPDCADGNFGAPGTVTAAAAGAVPLSTPAASATVVINAAAQTPTLRARPTMPSPRTKDGTEHWKDPQNRATKCPGRVAAAACGWSSRRLRLPWTWGAG